MANHLSNENSPYLLQHADNPVDWFPWGPEALEFARTQDKPIFLSIGYSACHWCHVMAHESFEDKDTAAIMNQYFINIKVDREQRPDLDSIYMSAVVSFTGQGGWPLSVFLTPDGSPFYGDTYFPPTARYGKAAFKDVLIAIDRAWKTERENLLETARELVTHIQKYQELNASEPNLSSKSLDEAAMRLAQSYDWKYGGWGKAPKFPQPMAIEFLLRRARRGDQLALQIALHALDAMAAGGMYDVVGGGFARYSTDNDWRTPHFEKMLYDNAQLARAYLFAYLLTHNDFYRRVCAETLDFIARELMAGGEQAGFFSSLDADSEGEEGKYYLWTPEEIADAFAAQANPQEDNQFFCAAFDVRVDGNFEGKTILQRAVDDASLAAMYGLTEVEVVAWLQRLHNCLFEARNRRIRPGTDDKVLTAWNGLALIAFAEAARYLNRSDYLEIARLNADFILKSLFVDHRLLRSWRAGKSQHAAFLEDHASLILGLLALYQSDPDPCWYTNAEMLAEQMIQGYQDQSGGFFDTRDDQTDLIVRPKDLQDNATPSGNALAALSLIQLSTFSAHTEWRDRAEKMLAGMLPTAARYPTAFAEWLNVADFALAPVKEVAIVGDPQQANTHRLLEVLWSRYRPDLVAAISGYPLTRQAPLILQDRPLLNNLPTAYVCQRFVCQAPVNDPLQLAKQLGD